MYGFIVDFNDEITYILERQPFKMEWLVFPNNIWIGNRKAFCLLPMLKINTQVGLYASDFSKSAYLARDIPPGLCDEHPAAVQTGRTAIYREASGS